MIRFVELTALIAGNKRKKGLNGGEDTEAENYEASEFDGLGKAANKSQVALQDDIKDPSLIDMF
jgi:hypothetical protein